MRGEVMSKFFSFLSDGRGKYWYSNTDDRQQMRGTDFKFKQDSHSAIAEWHKKKGTMAIGGGLNRYEFSPLTKAFKVEQINTRDDRRNAERWANSLDFSGIVPELIIKPIIDPRSKTTIPTGEDLELLRRWVSVRASVYDGDCERFLGSFGFVSGIVCHSIRPGVCDSIRDIAGPCVWGGVRDIIWERMCETDAGADDSAWDFVWDSFWDSAWSYISSFVSVKKWRHIDRAEGENPFQPAIDLWERCLVPSFDGETWRLHSGPEMEIVSEVM
jgi:hypothetical protein